MPVHIILHGTSLPNAQSRLASHKNKTWPDSVATDTLFLNLPCMTLTQGSRQKQSKRGLPDLEAAGSEVHHAPILLVSALCQAVDGQLQ